MQLLAALIPTLDCNGLALTTSAAGRVSFTNSLGTASSVFVSNITTGTGTLGLQLIAISASTVTYQVVNTTTGGNAGSSISVGVVYIGMAN